MDVVYNQHFSHGRRQTPSSTNLHHLSLAPLTLRLPIDQYDHVPSRPPTSYLESRSIPTTPRLLSRSSSRSNLRRAASNANLHPLTKSRSSLHLAGSKTPDARSSRATKTNPTITTSAKEQTDSDWLLRTGATLTSSAADSKGQGWLTTRASSTSLTALHDEDEFALEQELALERSSRQASLSRRTSISMAGIDADDEYSPNMRRVFSRRSSESVSRVNSLGKMAMTRKDSRFLFTPRTAMKLEDVQNERERDDYFQVNPEYISEPDFVDLDEEVFNEREAMDDDIMLKKLARSGTLGLGSWMERLIGWNLFALEDDEDPLEGSTEYGGDSLANSMLIEGPLIEKEPSEIKFATVLGEKFPAPKDEEADWQKDAAWLMGVAASIVWSR